MKALVVGGSSWVGTQLVKQLAKKGYSLFATYNKNKVKSLSSIAKWLKIDITDNENLKNVLKDLDFDTVFHIASLPGDTGNPYEMINVNINGFHNILEVSRNKIIKKLVLSSSISAYEWYPATKFNKPLYLPVDESHQCRPRDMYSVTKRMQELLAITYYHQYKLPVTILRLTAVIGPEGRGGGKMWREFADSLKEGKEVQLPQFSEEDIGHFVDIRDVARMHIIAATNKRSNGEIFNCCGPSYITGKEFARIVRDLFPDVKVKFGFPWSMAQGGVLYFSMKKAKKIIDFEPEFDAEQSIISIKKWIEDNARV